MKNQIKILLVAASLFFCLDAAASEIAIYSKFIERWEGRSHKVYVCPAGYATIGVGHKILNHENFLKLTDEEIDKLLYNDVLIAYNDARILMPCFDEHPLEVRMILVDMSFNLGRTKFSKFVKALGHCKNKEYSKMADELRDSKWFNQVGNRSRHHYNLLKSSF